MTRRWTTPQAYMPRGAMNKAIVNATLLLRTASPELKSEVEADLTFFGKMKKEAEDALKAGTGNWRAI